MGLDREIKHTIEQFNKINADLADIKLILEHLTSIYSGLALRVTALEKED